MFLFNSQKKEIKTRSIATFSKHSSLKVASLIYSLNFLCYYVYTNMFQRISEWLLHNWKWDKMFTLVYK